MAKCSTWHVRIDLVDGGSGVSARGKLIGAPAAMKQQTSQEQREAGVTGTDKTEALTNWQPLADLAPNLVAALSCGHDRHLA